MGDTVQSRRGCVTGRDGFRMVGDEVQKSFNYVPGRSLEEELPLSVFREDELGEVGV